MRHPVIAIALLFSAQAFGQAGCEFLKEKDGIKVFACPTPGSELRTVRIEFSAKNATIAELEQILDAVPNYVDWQFRVKEASILERKSSLDMVYRTRIDTPPFVSNRELIVRMQKRKDPKGKRLDIIVTSDPYPYPADENIVRVPASRTVWNVIAAKDNTLQIKYTFWLDPGGTVPSWFINEVLATGPIETFGRLKKLLE